ncbi:hypothetical protein BDN72DRAFT_896046 [Pluteus cervinus]|uniref:Uncharacterized protein n=1 Tax=Pluteus cervinus TaxID=181527 RepID=A0ACD3AYX1_9AGAR|nr:hypothetical protein BDN72DRAFT_896046 [Pluteus cervinus]
MFPSTPGMISDQPLSQPIGSNKEQNNTQSSPPILPSSKGERQGRSDTPPQQAATQPDSGQTTHASGPTGPASDSQQGTAHDAPVRVIEVPGPKVAFKDQVIGYAQKTRGTLLNKPELKEHGEQVLEGRASGVKHPEA